VFLLDCNRNFHQNLYYFGLLSTDCLRISQSRRRRFTTNQFWTLFTIEGDTIFKFCLDSVIFPLHTVTFPWFPIKFMRSNHKKQYSKTGSFSNLLPNGSIYSVAPSIQRCRCTLARSFTIGFSLYAECSLFRCYINDTTNIFSSTLLEFSSSGFFLLLKYAAQVINGTAQISKLGEISLWKTSVKLTEKIITQSRRYNQPGSRV